MNPAANARVSKIIADQLGVDVEQVKPETRLIGDLGADSLDLVELVMILEDEYGIEIPDEDAEKVTTVKEVLDYIEKNTPALLMNDHLKLMVTRPGIYVIGTPQSRFYFRVEVDADGVVYQLTPDLKRDGVLAEDGWSPYSMVYIEEGDERTLINLHPAFADKAKTTDFWKWTPEAEEQAEKVLQLNPWMRKLLEP